jgi:hypothetical protein
VPQRGIAGGVTVGIVDLFEVVQIDGYQASDTVLFLQPAQGPIGLCW